ncbi:uncharacterized protein K02A2.6-like [Tigriopus californicus]|uniref:uncharacterized protein K02A2.6-like n=1 Tax=Tigriopus californicus TaxID=6832 RepID=UPI0027DAAE45|nr:uncharacterized protein K02A2.6-like [Tigriopus californicus]
MHCRMYLAGMNFTVITDHRPLLGIFKGSNLAAVDNPRLQRILMKTAGYTFTIQWIPGKNHRIADTLSRYPLFDDNSQDDDPPSTFDNSILLSAVQMESGSDLALHSIALNAKNDVNYQAVIATLLSGKSPKHLPQSHPAKLFTKQWDSLSLDHDNGLLILQGRRIILPIQSRATILHDLHQSHQGIRRTRALARSLYFWPGMNNDIEQVISACAQCQEFRPSQSPEPLRQSTATRPFESSFRGFVSQRWCALLDHGGPIYGLAVRVSPFSIGHADHNRHFEDWFADYGIPQHLRSDGGPQFRGGDFAEFCRRTHINHELSSAYHPASNGHAESAVKAMKTLLQKHGHNWRNFRPRPFGLAQRVHRARTDGFSPAQWLFGRGLRTRIPGHPAHYNRLSDHVWAQALQRREEESEKTQVRFDNTAIPLPPLQPHDTVLVQDPRTKKWNRSGLVIEPRRNHRSSYKVEIDGRISIRNRIHLRPVPMETASPDKVVTLSRARTNPSFLEKPAFDRKEFGLNINNLSYDANFRGR